MNVESLPHTITMLHCSRHSQADHSLLYESPSKDSGALQPPSEVSGLILHTQPNLFELSKPNLHSHTSIPDLPERQLQSHLHCQQPLCESPEPDVQYFGGDFREIL